MKSIYIIIVLAVMLTGCHKEEQPIDPHEPGENQYTEITVGKLYADQVWYDLENNVEVSRNKKTAWDFSYTCGPDSHYIVLNGANNQRAALTNAKELDQVTDTIGLTFKWDAPSGNLDSTAVGNWKKNGTIYVMDGGTDEYGNRRGLHKIIFDSANTEKLFFRYAAWNASSWTAATLQKESAYTYAYYSFTSGMQMTIAPPKNVYDFVFTQFTTAFYDMTPPVPYLVTGVVLNPAFASSAKIYDIEFEAITNSIAENYDWNQRIDNIGFDWKTYDLAAGYYTVFPDKNYVLVAKSGKRYKMHFLDWYNSDGEKGTATIEFAEL